jgi:hypothetical protein
LPSATTSTSSREIRDWLCGFRRSGGRSMPRDAVELAWAAGIFEGEGHFRLINNHSLRSAQAVVMMSDGDVVERFNTIFPGRLYHYEARVNPETGVQWKAMHRWNRSGLEAEAFGRSILPFMGKRRSKQIIDTLIVVEADHTRPCRRCDENFRSYHGQWFCSDECRRLYRNRVERDLRAARIKSNDISSGTRIAA